MHVHTHTARHSKNHIHTQHAGLERQAETGKQGGRSRRAESKGNTARKSRVLTDRNDYPQNSHCDVVTYEVVITRSWDEQKERKKKRKKNNNKQKVLFPNTLPQGRAREKHKFEA